MTYDLSKLIHPQEFFTDAYLEARRAEYGFTQLSKVKTFLWDFELYGHLQERLQGKLILKGGAAAQLHFAPREQRTSVDIDAIFTGSETELTSALDEMHIGFGGDANFFKFNKHTPKNPTRLLPLLTYFVSVPDPIDAEAAKKQINIKIDFHMLDKLESKTVFLRGRMLSVYSWYILHDACQSRVWSVIRS